MKRIAAAILIAFSATGARIGSAGRRAAAACRRAPAFDLEQDVNRVMRAFDVPGIAMAIVKDGKVVAAQGFGVRKLGAAGHGRRRRRCSRSPPTRRRSPPPRWRCWSTRASWHGTTGDRPPAGFQMYDAYVTREMTVRDLLTHRSGLGLGAGDLLLWPTTDFSARRNHPAAALHQAGDELPQRLRLRQPAVHRGRQDHRAEVRQDPGATRCASASSSRSA